MISDKTKYQFLHNSPRAAKLTHLNRVRRMFCKKWAELRGSSHKSIFAESYFCRRSFSAIFISLKQVFVCDDAEQEKKKFRWSGSRQKMKVLFVCGVILTVSVFTNATLHYMQNKKNDDDSYHNLQIPLQLRKLLDTK